MIKEEDKQPNEINIDDFRLNAEMSLKSLEETVNVEDLRLTGEDRKVLVQREPKTEKEKFDSRSIEYQAVLQFMEWCRFHSYTIVGPDPFAHKRSEREKISDKIDIVRSESIHGSPLDAIWCKHIGVDYEEYQKEQLEQMDKAIDEALGETNDVE